MQQYMGAQPAAADSDWVTRWLNTSTSASSPWPMRTIDRLLRNAHRLSRQLVAKPCAVALQNRTTLQRNAKEIGMTKSSAQHQATYRAQRPFAGEDGNGERRDSTARPIPAATCS